MATHTKKPWGVYNGTDVFTDYPNALDGFHIADCRVHQSLSEEYGEMTVAEQEANARLIAAAPDMLDALALFIHVCEHGDHEDGFNAFADAYNAACAAVRRATEGR